MSEKRNNKTVPQKYDLLRSELIKRGVTLRGWALENSLPVSTVYGAAQGIRAGVKATRIRTQLEELIHGN